MTLPEAVALIESYPESAGRSRARTCVLNGKTDRPPDRIFDPTEAEPGIGLTWFFQNVHVTLRFRDDGFTAVSAQSAYPIAADDFPTVMIPPPGG